MSNPIKIGVLGCANIAERFVIPAIKESTKLFELIGVASRSSDKARQFAEKFDTSAFTNYQSLINVDNLQAVYIPLPNSMHYEWIKKALQKDKHVLVEKSLACTLDQVEELNQLAKERRCILVENFQFIHHSQLQYIKDLIASDVIGELRIIRSSFGFPPFQDEDNIRYSKQLGGGALLDAGAYPLKIVQELLNKEVCVDSASLFMDEKKQVDIWGSAQLKAKKSPVTAQVAFGFDNFYQCNVELWGAKGYIKANRIFTSPPGFKPEIEVYTTQGKTVTLLPEDNHFNNMLNHFNRLINQDCERDSEYQQNINQARLISELKSKSNA
jgi:dTDP-3,4-didehydro-2,6-dideoxy-alpha-D-glucose 3-reductase